MIDQNLAWLGAAAAVLLPAMGVVIYQRVKSGQRKSPAALTTLLRLRQRRR